MSGPNNGPPRLAEWLLSQSIAPNIRYGVMGDFEQIYTEMAEHESSRAAKGWYWRQVARSLPFFISDTLAWTLIMLKNYFRVAYRNLYKNKTSSVVNIVGLSLAVASAILAFLFIENTYTMDWYHDNGKNIFLVENQVSRGQDGLQLRGDTPIPLGPAMQASIPQVKRAVRVSTGGASFRSGNDTFREFVWYVDTEFQDVFSFQLRLGDKSAPLEYDDIILSDALATKYFADANPIGQELTLTFSDSVVHTFKVKGVAAPFSSKASFTFTSLVHFDHLANIGVDETKWEITTRATFIEVDNPSDIDVIASQMDAFRIQQNEVNDDRPIASFELANLRTLSANSRNVTGDISGGSHPAAVIVLGVVALFLLLLSCINYMNLAVATASRRLKEIGVRKAMGSSKQQIVAQFLTENILVCALALATGYAVAYFLFVPGFNSLFDSTGGGMSFEAADTRFLWVFLGGLLLATGLISGAYPAFYISSFRPTAIFRGRTNLGGDGLFTRGMLTFQFVLAFLTMIMGVVLVQNANYQEKRDWGYDSEHRLIVSFQDNAGYALLRGEIVQLPGVENTAGASDHFTRRWNSLTIDVDGAKYGADRFDVGDGFLEMYDLSVLSGTGFDSASMTSIDGNVIVNQSFAQEHGWSPDEALGKQFRQDSTAYTVSAVVSDFIYDDFLDRIEPAFLRAVPESDYLFMTVKVSPGTGAETEKAVQAIWKRLLPGEEYQAFFQDTVFQSTLRENTNIKKIFMFIAGMALIIACMGLFGLVAQKVARRMREISIRKVLGASVPDLAKRMNRGFLIILVIAAVIASPLGYVAMTALLSSIYDDPISIGPSSFIVSFALVVGTATLTILSQLRKLVRANPVDVLRSE